MPQPPTMDLSKLRGRKRRSVNANTESLVASEPLERGQEMPLLVRPQTEGVDLASWAAGQRDWIEKELDSRGAVLFRGFGLDQPDDVETFIDSVWRGSLEYRDRVQPRSQVHRNVYTSTEYPPDQVIEQHNENSYAYTFPQRIVFLCLVPAEKGGFTPLTDGRAVVGNLDPELRDRLLERELMYVRNLGEGFGISWQTAFQTEDREDMEAFCEANQIEVEWRGGDRVRTRSVRPAILRHPVAGELSWFNALVSSHDSTLEPSVRQALLTDYAPDELPKNVFWGDGSPIEPETLAEIRRTIAASSLEFPWQAGDLLALDNILVAHGRTAYEGPRRVVVGMAKPTDLGQLAA